VGLTEGMELGEEVGMKEVRDGCIVKDILGNRDGV